MTGQLASICLGLSPCPNDTFAIHAWLTQRFSSSLLLQPAFADIETLNDLALTGQLPITKVSAPHLARLPHYRLLPAGAALGRGVGPKVIARKPFPLSDLAERTVAFPGKFTAAYALYHRLLPAPRHERFLRYDQLMGRLRRGEVDAAVIIHEARFTFCSRGFVELCDLGQLWEAQTQLPIPLGVLAAREDVSEELERQVVWHLRQSLQSAWEDPRASRSFISQYAAELSAGVCQQHIELYVNQETHTLTDGGRAAISALCSSR